MRHVQVRQKEVGHEVPDRKGQDAKSQQRQAKRKCHLHPETGPRRWNKAQEATKCRNARNKREG